MGLRSFRQKTAGPVRSYKKGSQSKQPQKTEIISESHNEIIDIPDTKSVEVSAQDKSVTRSVPFGPTRAVHTDMRSQTTLSVAAERVTRRPVPMTTEPAGASPSVSPKEMTQLSYNPTETQHSPITKMETSSLEQMDQTHIMHGSSAANPSTVPINPTAKALPTSHLTYPTFITSTQSTVTPTEKTSSAKVSSPTLSHDTSTPVSTTTLTETTRMTKQAAQVKKKYSFRWEKVKMEDIDEPMQRQVESTSGKSGK